MHLDKNEQIAGMNVRAVRDLLKRQDRQTFTVEWVQEKLRIPKAAAKRLVTELVKRGLLTNSETIERGRRVTSKDWFETTTEGNAFGLASFAPRMSRAKADELLATVIRNAEEANQLDGFADYVDEIRVFGSYLTDAPDLGDLDLAIATTQRVEGRAYTDLCLAIARENPGRLSILERYAYATGKLHRFLKGKSRRISLHAMGELERLDPRPDSRIIFKRD